MARLMRHLAPGAPAGAALRLLLAAVLLFGVFLAGVVFTGGGLSSGPFMTNTVFDFVLPLLALPLALLCLALALAAPVLVRGRALVARLGLGAAVAMAGALALLLTAGVGAGGVSQRTCAGARTRLQPAAAPGATGATLEFTGSRGEWHTPPFVAGEGWTVAWTSDVGELHVDLYDPTHPRRRGTAPGRGPAFLGSLLDYTGHQAVSGRAAPGRPGPTCLTIASGFHYEPGVDNARRAQPRWRVTIEGARLASQ